MILYHQHIPQKRDDDVIIDAIAVGAALLFIGFSFLIIKINEQEDETDHIWHHIADLYKKIDAIKVVK